MFQHVKGGSAGVDKDTVSLVYQGGGSCGNLALVLLMAYIALGKGHQRFPGQSTYHNAAVSLDNVRILGNLLYISADCIFGYLENLTKLIQGYGFVGVNILLNFRDPLGTQEITSL